MSCLSGHLSPPRLISILMHRHCAVVTAREREQEKEKAREMYFFSKKEKKEDQELVQEFVFFYKIVILNIICIPQLMLIEWERERAMERG